MISSPDRLFCVVDPGRADDAQYGFNALE